MVLSYSKLTYPVHIPYKLIFAGHNILDNIDKDRRKTQTQIEYEEKDNMDSDYNEAAV